MATASRYSDGTTIVPSPETLWDSHNSWRSFAQGFLAFWIERRERPDRRAVGSRGTTLHLFHGRIPEVVDAAVHLQRRDAFPEEFPYALFGAPEGRRLYAGWRGYMSSDGLELLPAEAPPGVQFASPILPPERHTLEQLRRRLFLVGTEHHPDRGEHHVERGVLVGKVFGITDFE